MRGFGTSSAECSGEKRYLFCFAVCGLDRISDFRGVAAFPLHYEYRLPCTSRRTSQDHLSAAGPYRDFCADRRKLFGILSFCFLFYIWALDVHCSLGNGACRDQCGDPLGKESASFFASSLPHYGVVRRFKIFDRRGRASGAEFPVSAGGRDPLYGRSDFLRIAEAALDAPDLASFRPRWVRLPRARAAFSLSVPIFEADVSPGG